VVDLLIGRERRFVPDSSLGRGGGFKLPDSDVVSVLLESLGDDYSRNTAAVVIVAH
jgi:hypothetical protein